MKTRTDKTLMILTALFVGALAIVAGAISFSHMRELALDHDQLGWKSLAFPISVDGLEIVASLYLARRAAYRLGAPVQGKYPDPALFPARGLRRVALRAPERQVRWWSGSIRRCLRARVRRGPGRPRSRSSMLSANNAALRAGRSAGSGMSG
jgi:hypothetical protein